MFSYGAYLNETTKESLRQELRTKQCIINILHAMLSDQTSTFCNLNNVDELNNPHSNKFEITQINPGRYKIEWKNRNNSN